MQKSRFLGANTRPTQTQGAVEVIPPGRQLAAPQPLAGGGGGHEHVGPHGFTKTEALAHELGAHRMGRETEREKLPIFIAGMGVGAFVMVLCAWAVLSLFGDSLKEAMGGGVVIGRSTTQWDQVQDQAAKQERNR